MLLDEMREKVNKYLSQKCVLWKYCEAQQDKEGNSYKQTNMDNLKNAIFYAVDKIETIEENLPNFTLHGFTHSRNVLDLMAKLLDNMGIINLHNGTSECMSSFEIALLILAAFFHDIGMCKMENDNVTEEPYYQSWMETKILLGEDIIEKQYIRECHHLRAALYINAYSEDEKSEEPRLYWINDNTNRVPFSQLIEVCQSHNEGKEKLEHMTDYEGEDEKFCAIILRLADILDLDNTRAPLDKMKKIDSGNSEEELKSWYEWKKHRDANGILFESNGILRLKGKTNDITVYQKLMDMVDWIDNELNLSREVLRHTSIAYRDKQLPQAIMSIVSADGFIPKPYRYEIQKKQIMDLFMGEKLYMDKLVFIRELLQNAIDAAFYYQKINPSKQANDVWVQIWRNSENQMFFMIVDNGTGMNEEIMDNYFLKIGKSFYQSKQFLNSGIQFVPISRFGIGFLSAFLVTDEIEVVTKHYNNSKELLQLTVNKDSDYYMLRKNDEKRRDIKKTIIDWDNKERQLYKFFDKKECGTLIYFKIDEQKFDGDLEQYVNTINKYLFAAPVKVECNVAGTIVKRETMPEQFMKQIRHKLNKENVCRKLHINPEEYSDANDIIFESLPLTLHYEDEKGKVDGSLQVITVYDTERIRKNYNFTYTCDYEKDSITIRLGDYSDIVADVELNSEFKELGISDKVKVYFNGINHLSTFNELQGHYMKSSYCNGYLALEGIFRPEVDVTRSGKGYLNLKALACLNYLYWEKLQDLVKDDICRRDVYFSAEQPDILRYVSTIDFKENNYLMEISDYNWEKLSIIKTEDGFLSVNEIEIQLKENRQEIELLEDISFTRLDDFRKFIIAYLIDKHFDLVLRIKDSKDRIYIREKNILKNYEFPPLTFISYDSMEILKFGNYPLNREHWFSKWFVEKSESEEFGKNKGILLHEFQRDIWNHFARRDDMIKTINKVLQMYSQKLLEKRDIVIYKSKDLDLRKWLQGE